MTVNVHVLNACHRLDDFLASTIRAAVSDAANLISDHVPVEKVDVIVQLCEFDVSARAYGPDSFTIYVNPAAPDLQSWTRDRFCQLAVHEFHHVLRWRSLNLLFFTDWTPGEVLALEGLASNSELLLGFPSYPKIEIDDSLVDPLLNRIAPDVGARYAEVNWFDGPCGLPVDNVRAAGAMGHLLVRRFLRITGETPFTALKTPWGEIWRTVMETKAADPERDTDISTP